MRVKDPGSEAGLTSGGVGAGVGGMAGFAGGGGSGVMLWSIRVSDPAPIWPLAAGAGAGTVGLSSGYFALVWVSTASGFEAVPNSLSKSSSDSDDAGG